MYFILSTDAYAASPSMITFSAHAGGVKSFSMSRNNLFSLRYFLCFFGYKILKSTGILKFPHAIMSTQNRIPKNQDALVLIFPFCIKGFFLLRFSFLLPSTITYTVLSSGIGKTSIISDNNHTKIALISQ